MSLATRDGRTCRCPAVSSKCSSASSRCPAPQWSPMPRRVATDYSGSATADHPPGFYGPPESVLAVNTLAVTDRLAPLDFSPLVNASREIYRTSEPQDLRGPIFLTALALLMLDTIVVLFLGGG